MTLNGIPFNWQTEPVPWARRLNPGVEKLSINKLHWGEALMKATKRVRSWLKKGPPGNIVTCAYCYVCWFPFFSENRLMKTSHFLNVLICSCHIWHARFICIQSHITVEECLTATGALKRQMQDVHAKRSTGRACKKHTQSHLSANIMWRWISFKASFRTIPHLIFSEVTGFGWLLLLGYAITNSSHYSRTFVWSKQQIRPTNRDISSNNLLCWDMKLVQNF